MNTSKAVIIVLFCCMISLQGCAAVVGAGAGAGAVAYVEGEYQENYAASFSRTWEASLAALKDLNIAIYNTEKDETGGTIEATKKDGTKVKINIKPTGSDTTLVKIRIGVFGDEDTSRMIGTQISKRLGKKG